MLSSNTTPTYTYTTGTLSGSSATFKVRVTDSRGRQNIGSASAITIEAYAVPAFSNTSVYRCNSSGTAQNDGTYIRVTASAVATPSENSITALTYATKATTSSTWSAEANVGSGVTASGFANTTSYDVRITATDKLGNKSYKYYTIPTAEYTMDFKVGGKGVAFGKVAETDNLVDSAWDIKAPWFDGNWKYVRNLDQSDDLNLVTEFGKYSQTTIGNAPQNCPTSMAFTLYVVSAQGSDSLSGAWKYANQIIRVYNEPRIYVRVVSTDGNGALVFGQWGSYYLLQVPVSVANGGTGMVSPTDNASVMSGCRLYKWGPVVWLSMRGANINSSGYIATLPEGYRPNTYFYGTGIYDNGTNRIPASLTIEGSGTILVGYYNGTRFVTPTSGNVSGELVFLSW